MDEITILTLCGIGALGVSFGLFLGIIVSRKLGITPEAKALEKVIESNEQYYKQQLARLKGRFKEYEQPSEMQQLAGTILGGNVEGDALLNMISNELPNIKGIPKWMRPAIPGIQAWLKENPEQAQAIIAKFTAQVGKGGKDEAQPGLDAI